MEEKSEDRQSPFLFTGSSFTVTQSKKEGSIEIQTNNLTRVDAEGLAKWLLGWVKGGNE